jgi:hypothetical protein
LEQGISPGGIIINNEPYGYCFTGDHRIYNNLVSGMKFGITVGSEPEGCLQDNNKIHSNTIIDSTLSNIYFWRTGLGGTGNEIKNNIFLQTSTSVGSNTNNNNPSGYTWSNNLFYGGNSVSGNAANNAVLADPLLEKSSGWISIAPGTADPTWWSLREGSPAIDAGANLGSSYNLDFNGVSRPQGNGWDIGAFEFTSGTSPTCVSSGYQCCDSCLSNPHPEFDGDCPNQVCCGECTVPPSVPVSCQNLKLLMHFNKNLSEGETNTFVKDFSGNENHGTMNGNAVHSSAAGRFGGAFQFDGIDDFVTLPIIPLQDSSFTISTWIKPTINPNDNREIYFYAHKESTQQNALHLQIYNFGRFRFGYYADDLDAEDVVNYDQWNYIVVSYDESTDTSKIYFDGNEVASGNQGPLLGTPSEVLIGNWDSSPNLFFRGVLDEFAIWDKALSSSEISDLYNSGAQITCEVGSICGLSDSNSDGIVTISELIDYISQWKIGNVPIGDLIDAIGKWKGGC